MKAIRIHGRGGLDPLVYEDVPQPHPGPGEVLVRVYATGVIVNELRWNETYETKAGSKRVLPIPGRDLSGVVVEVGSSVTALTEGAEVAIGRPHYTAHEKRVSLISVEDFTRHSLPDLHCLIITA